LDDFSTGRSENLRDSTRTGRMELVIGSVVESDVVEWCMSRCDACFHLASTVGVELVLQQPLQALLAMTRGDDTILASAARWSRPLVLASTSEVYGRPLTPVVDEDCERVLGPVSKLRWNYATAKAVGEALALSYARERGCPMTVARLFNVVGARQVPDWGMVLPRFVGQAVRGEDLTVYGDGRQLRCFTHVADVVDALRAIADEPQTRGRVLNVGTDRTVTILDLARSVIAQLRSSSQVRLVPYDEAFGNDHDELGTRIPDTSALRELTGWTCRRGLADAIDDAVTTTLARQAPATEVAA
jgi:UDP-glucose 4-epimerase